MTAACPACAAMPAAVDIAASATTPQIQLSVPGLRCAACLSNVERHLTARPDVELSLIQLPEPTRPYSSSYAVFCLKKKRHSLR